MNYENLCNLANNLIEELSLVEDNKVVDYIIGEVVCCGYCDIEAINGDDNSE